MTITTLVTITRQSTGIVVFLHRFPTIPVVGVMIRSTLTTAGKIARIPIGRPRDWGILNTSAIMPALVHRTLTRLSHHCRRQVLRLVLLPLWLHHWIGTSVQVAMAANHFTLLGRKTAPASFHKTRKFKDSPRNANNWRLRRLLLRPLLPQVSIVLV